jgi:succinate dehydrogenase hydrophobic anchor subunit
LDSRFGKWVWLAQAASGVALIALVGAHWVAQHYVAAGGERSYAEVAAFLSSPVALVAEVCFLVIVTAHTLLGVRAILLDFAPGFRARRVLNWGLVAAGAAIVWYGVDLIRAVLK